MRFTLKEVRDLLISVVVLALIFSSFDSSMFLPTLFVMFAVFASHEILGHKLIAQHYECDAEYKIWPLGLLLGIITSLIGGFVFAAPGAVYISPVIRKKFAFTVARLSQKQYAIISLGGPLVNIIVGLLAVIANLYVPWNIFLLTAQISFFLAVFNLIPFPPLDGQKIIGWDWRVWLVLFASAAAGSIYLWLF